MLQPAKKVLPSAVTLSLFVLALQPRSAWAYIDPGAGSLFLQGILLGTGGLVVFFKLVGKRLKALLPGKKDALAPEEQQSSHAAPSQSDRV